MQKTYKNGIISGNSIRFSGYNTKTTRNFVIINDDKIKLNKLNTNNKTIKNSSKKFKNYKNDYDLDIYDYDEE